MVKSTRKTRKRTRYRKLNVMNITGAGGYGIVITNTKKAIKLFLDTDACAALKTEAQIHQTIYDIVRVTAPEIRVPNIETIQTEPLMYRGTHYLCGITMDYLQPPLDFDEQVHCCLGYSGSDIDSSWGQKMGLPIGPTNPTRGFFASPETLEYIWKTEGDTTTTIESVARSMGKCLRQLLEHDILPIDIEWVWSEGRLCMLDFGLCTYGHKDPFQFLHTRGVYGLADDFYVPHAGQRGYDAFLEGYKQAHIV